MTLLPRRARRLLDLFPLTPFGVMAAAASYAALQAFAFAEMDRVLLVVGSAGLGLCALCASLVAIAATRLKLRRQPAGEGETRMLETGIAVGTGFSLPSLGWLPLVRVRWSWEEPAGADIEIERNRAGTLGEVATVHDRGQIRRVSRRVVVEDALGIGRVAIRSPTAERYDVLPRLGGLGSPNALLSLAGGDDLPHPAGIDDGDRLELRRYLPGDPARFIHWKVLARTRRLMIRAPERALSSERRTAAFMVAGLADDASAAAARAALMGGILGDDWLFGSDLEVGTGPDLEEALAILMRSSEARDSGGAGLLSFVEQVEKQGPCSAMVFAPPGPGVWMQRVLELAGRRRVQVVIAVDPSLPAERPRLWQRLLLRDVRAEDGADGPSSVEGLLEVAQALNSSGCTLTMLDRTTGRPLPEQHLRF